METLICYLNAKQVPFIVQKLYDENGGMTGKQILPINVTMKNNKKETYYANGKRISRYYATVLFINGISKYPVMTNQCRHNTMTG